MEKILMNKREELKRRFLEETYTNDQTRIVYYNLYKYYVKPIEDETDKDAYMFTENNITQLFDKVCMTQMTTKKSIASFLKQYMGWCVERGIRRDGINIMSSMNLNELIKYSPKLEQMKRSELEEFIRLIDKAANTTEMDMQQLMVIVLMRYGISGDKFDWATNLKWEDIDEENLTATIWNEDRTEIVTILPVDYNFLRFADKAKEIEVMMSNGKIYPYVNTGYVLRTSTKTSNDKYSYQGISSLVGRFCSKMGIPKFSAGKMRTDRKLDVLFEIKERKALDGEKLTIADFKNVDSLYRPTACSSHYHGLIKKYEAINGKDDIERIRDTRVYKD